MGEGNADSKVQVIPLRHVGILNKQGSPPTDVN